MKVFHLLYGLSILFSATVSYAGTNSCNSTPPANLHTTNISACKITLSWSAVEGAAFYKVKYKASGGVWIKVPDKIYDTSYTLNDLAANTKYTLGVNSFCNDGSRSTYSLITRTTTSCDIPTLNPVKADSVNNVMVSWSSCLPSNNNSVRYKLVKTGPWVTVNTGVNQFYMFPQAIKGITYYYQAGTCTDTSYLSPLDSFRISIAPNILLIIIDDGRNDSYSCNGGPDFYKSPNVDMIANQGVNFKNSFVTYSLCAPGRASLITGLYPHNNGVLNNHYNLDSSFATIATILHPRGYYTALVGKYLHESLDNTPKPGWDFWMAKDGGGKVNPHYNYNGAEIKIPGHELDIVTDTAIRVFSSHLNKQPILMVTAFSTPHSPYVPEQEDVGIFANDTMPFPANFFKPLKPYPSFLDSGQAYYPDSITCRNDIEAYYECLVGLDRVLGELWDTISKLSSLNNFLVLFTSDNGFFLGEHQFSGKQLTYNNSVRVPMFLQYPKWFQRGSVITDQMALNIDFAPTILEAAGVENIYQMDGVSLHDLYTGRAKRSVIFAEDLPDSGAPDINSVRTLQYLYNWYSCSSSTEEFFDLTADPLEEYNQINNPAYASLINEYRNKKDSLKNAFHYKLTPDIKPCNLVENKLSLKQVSSDQWHAHAFPNPADRQLYLTVGPTDESLDAGIYNASGKMVLHQTIQTSDLPQTVTLNVASLEEAMYYLEVKNRYKNVREKIVIVH